MSNDTNASTRQRLTALAHHVVQHRAGIGVCALGDRSARALHHVELASMGGAVPGRVMEFVAGRVAARQAMGRDLAIPMGEDRAPVWPEGWVGSITHGAGWAVAAAISDPVILGLDLEPDEALPADVWDLVLSGAERHWCNSQEQPGQAARLIFSIKECAYKAQYPRSRQVFGFERFAVTVADGEFEARFTADTGPFAAGSVLPGRHGLSDGIILTGIVL